MFDVSVPSPRRAGAGETGAAAAGTFASLAALFSAAACCVLPLALTGAGIGAAGLAVFVPYRWPLTIAAALVTAVGWTLYLRKRRACAANAGCTAAAPGPAVLVLLSMATAMVAICAFWGFIEQPLVRALGGG